MGGVVGAQVGAAVLISSHIPGTDLPSRSGYVTAFAMSAVAAIVGAGIAILATPGRTRPRRHLIGEGAD